MKSLYGLTFQYEENNGIFLRTGREPAILSSELNPIEYRMLQHNQIPRLLPIDFEETDRRLTIACSVTGLRSMSQALRRSRPKSGVIVRMLYQIAQALEDSKAYMLNERRYVLEEDLIFTDPNLADVRLMYLPFRDLPDKAELRSDWEQLVKTALAHSREPADFCCADLLRFLREEPYSTVEWKRRLLRWSDHLSESSASVTVLGKREPSRAKVAKTEASPPEVITEISKENEPASVQLPSCFDETMKTSVERSFSRSSEARTGYLFGALPLAAAWTWAVSSGEEGALHIALGCSLLVPTLFLKRNAWFAWSGGSFWRKRDGRFPHRDSSPDQANEDWRGEMKRDFVHSRIDLQLPEDEDCIEQETLHGEQTRQHEEMDNYYTGLQNRTTLLGTPDVTVFLGGDPAAGSGGAYLVVESEGRTETIRLPDATFVIGRQPGQVDRVDLSLGVSRQHAECVRTRKPSTPSRIWAPKTGRG